MTWNFFHARRQLATARTCRHLLVCVASILLSATALAQNHRSAWMWSTSSHAYGAANVLGDSAKESELISYFGAWGYDRIYTSVGNTPVNDPTTMARWNAALDDVGMDSQTLYGLVPGSPTQVANLVQTKLINFNDSRADPREHFDGVHLDIEPHASSAWQTATKTEKRDMLFVLRDTYSAARAQLDSNGYPGVKIYADLPVWYDSTSAIGWTDIAERNQWFDDIALSLDGITMMAFERNLLSSITSGVGWEVAHFDGEVRVGLNVNEVGPGDTFEDYEEMIGMADSLEAFYGTAITGIDFQPLITYTDLAPTPVLTADFDEDGDVDGTDFLALQRGLGIETGATLSQGDANGSGAVNRSDLALWQQQFGTTLSAEVTTAVPEPESWVLASVALLAMIHLSPWKVEWLPNVNQFR